MKISLSLYARKYSQVIRYEKLEFVSSISLAVHLHLGLMSWVMQQPVQSPIFLITKNYFTVVLIPVSPLWQCIGHTVTKTTWWTAWVSFFGTL